MIDPRKVLAGIESRLMEIPERKFVEVVSLLEQIGDRPEVQQTIHTIRPRLVRLRPARRLTLRRIFCDPFEDLLGIGPEETRCGGLRRIDRSVIAPLWHTVESLADPAELAALRRKVTHLPATDADARHTLGLRVWILAARTLRKALAGIDSDPCLKAAFAGGGEDRLRQAREIADFLETGHQIALLKRRLSPKPVEEISPDDADAIAELARDVARDEPRRVLPLLLVAAARLRQPADLVPALAEADLGRARRDKAGLLAVLSSAAIAELETGAGDAPPPETMPEATADLAERLVEGIAATEALREHLRDGDCDERLDRIRASVRSMVDAGLLEAALPAIVGPRVAEADPDGRFPIPDAAVQERAEDHARALRRCQGFAAEIGIEAKLAETLDTVGKGIDRRLDILLAAMSAAAAGGEEDATGEGLVLGVAYALRLQELVRGPASSDARRDSGIERLLASAADLDS